MLETPTSGNILEAPAPVRTVRPDLKVSDSDLRLIARVLLGLASAFAVGGAVSVGVPSAAGPLSGLAVLTTLAFFLLGE